MILNLIKINRDTCILVHQTAYWKSNVALLAVYKSYDSFDFRGGERYISWSIVSRSRNKRQSITYRNSPWQQKSRIWRHCHQGNNKKRKMEEGTVVIDSGRRETLPFVWRQLFSFITFYFVSMLQCHFPLAWIIYKGNHFCKYMPFCVIYCIRRWHYLKQENTLCFILKRFNHRISLRNRFYFLFDIRRCILGKNLKTWLLKCSV